MAEWMFEPIQRELGYLLCFNSNIQELETRLDELKATRSDIQRMEDAEKKMGKTLGDRAQLWIRKADRKIVEAQSVLNDKADLKKGCFSIKWCPNLILRFSLGKKGKKSSLVLIELQSSGGQLPHTCHSLPMPSINMRDYNGDALNFESRSKIMEDIIEMLLDEETMLIGICGMGGIGKTTFAKQVLQKVNDSYNHLFEIQVMSTVSNSPNFNAIQQEVAHMLGSSLKDVDGEIARAHHLRNAFSNKKVVVLLDDVWKEFDLNAKGFPISKSDDGCCCKIIYTSRNKDLWSGESNITKQEFSLDALSFEEALNLFSIKVGLHGDDDTDFPLKNKIARQIVDECKGLPLALEVTGGALVKKRKYAWEDMFFKLRNQQLHSDKIHNVVQTSYDFLEDPNARRLFLLCCLFQEDKEIPIETLYRFAVGLQLFNGMNDLKCISDRVYTLVDDLTRRNLIINVKEHAVKMHDVVRDVGISIAKQEENNINFLECDGVDKLENIVTPRTKMISILFKKNDLEVPNTMEFRGSKLELLRLDSSYFHQPNIKLPGNLLRGADNLKVLDIVSHQGKISEFPLFLSFPYLSKLKMLSLERLSLNMRISVSSIGHIKCLEILCLRSSKIRVLPNEISELTNLKLLDLSRCKCFISNGILSRLTNLQERYMWHGFKDWRLLKEDVNGGDNHAAGLDELNLLHKLWRLELEVPNIEQVPRGVKLFSCLTLLAQFKIRIGGGRQYIKFESGERQLWIENVRDNTSFLHELGVLIEKDVTNLYLCDDPDMGEKMHLNNFLSLKDIVLKHCGSLFPHSQSRSPHISGRNFRRIEIYGCNQMRHLCSTSISRNLTKLKVLVLQECEMIEEVVSFCDKTEQLNKIEFNTMETLKLWELSSLEYFCKGINLEMPCLEELSMISIPNIETLCMPPSLQKLNMDSCDNFQYVDFSNSLVISHLRRLTIKNCRRLKGVVGVTTEAEERQPRKSIEFTNLSTLDLESLDELASFVIDVNNMGDEEKKSQSALFYHNDYQVSFPCLTELKISGLPKINYILGWKEGEGYPHHHDKRFPPGLGILLFQNLKQLKIFDCGKLRYLFSENIGRVTAKNLVKLAINKCPMMEVVMKKEEELIIEDDDDKEVGNSLGNTHFFPLLKKLSLLYLSGLRSFSNVAYTWALPSLQHLTVLTCPELEALSPDYLDSPRLRRFLYDYRKQKEENWKGDVNKALSHLFIKTYKEAQPVEKLENMDEEEDDDEE
ncbi:probable disease resistance protein At5g63020 [Impatiens glandulifera]|uniref:probable disease resistance protein At5g63020 n=1 Tax=Impatiens glandulifera TaxID=253017 RepID=UPI001FB1583E|nr:probable disease resistance protein At5g63020 [Impatiens glandulifera]